MHFAQNGMGGRGEEKGKKKENSLIHNITPRLSMQIHSTLETEKLTISTTLQEKAINCVKPCSI